MTGVDLKAAAVGVQRQGFTEVVEAAFRKTVADLAVAAQAEGLAFPDAVSAITTGAQTAVMRALARFMEHEDAEALADVACLVVRELAPVAYREELERRVKETNARLDAEATTAGNA